MNDKGVLIVGNVAIVQSQEGFSEEPPVLKEDDLSFETIALPVAPSKAVSEDEYASVTLLFGSWIESGNEEEQLEELYKSRLIPSTKIDE